MPGSAFIQPGECSHELYSRRVALGNPGQCVEQTSLATVHAVSHPGKGNYKTRGRRVSLHHLAQPMHREALENCYVVGKPGEVCHQSSSRHIALRKPGQGVERVLLGVGHAVEHPGVGPDHLCRFRVCSPEREQRLDTLQFDNRREVVDHPRETQDKPSEGRTVLVNCQGE